MESANAPLWLEILQAIVPFIIVLYYVIDTIRNWGGSPELKVLRDDMRKTHEHLENLIVKL